MMRRQGNRGRGGRQQGRGRGGRRPREQRAEVERAPKVVQEEKEVGLLEGAGLQRHLTACKSDPKSYLAEVTAPGLCLSSANKGRILATLWAQGERESFERILSSASPGDVFAMVKVLDAPRLARQLRRKLAALPQSATGRISRLRCRLGDIEKELHLANMSGALARRVRRWVGGLSVETLEYTAIHFPLAPWRELANLCHLKRHDFLLPYFLPLCYGVDAPAGTYVADVKGLTVETLGHALKRHPQLATQYSELRKRFPDTAAYPAEVKAALANAAPLEDLLWYVEELHNAEVEATMGRRLREVDNLVGTKGRITYGKFMEQLLRYREKGMSFWKDMVPHAEAMLQRLKATHGLECGKEGSRVAVFGDCSGSMEVAVKAATIVGSFVSVCLDAQLSFFHIDAVRPSIQPSTAEEVIRVADEVEAVGGTCPAACLWDLYKRKDKVDHMVVVTDEVENVTFVEGADGLNDSSRARQGKEQMFTAVAGQTKIAGAATDKFGNALGAEYDLGVDGAFEGFTVHVLHLYTMENFDFKLPQAALETKGFAVNRLTKVPPPAKLKEWLADATQLWLISSSSSLINEEHYQMIKEFHDNGGSLYIWGDNDPYFTDANFVLQRLVGPEFKLSGNAPGNRTMHEVEHTPTCCGKAHCTRPGFRPHLLTTGLEYLFEGITIASLQPEVAAKYGFTELLYGSASDLVCTIRESEGTGGKGALMVSGAFTQLYCHWDTAGSGRFVKNAACFLASQAVGGFEEDAEEGRMKPERFSTLFTKYREEVNPTAKVTFVSLLEQNKQGAMMRDLAKAGVEAKQFRIDPTRPDLSKFDRLLDLIRAELDGKVAEGSVASKLPEVAKGELQDDFTEACGPSVRQDSDSAVVA